jgi:hypothetical protein
MLLLQVDFLGGSEILSHQLACFPDGLHCAGERCS